jgi:ADP-heptose:LPS heptosyltransferase
MNKEIIVYIENSGIGNLIMSSPMLQAIKKAKPECWLVVLSWNRAARILEGVPYIDELIKIEQLYRLLAHFM